MNPRSQCMLTVFDRRQELMENMMIVCLYVSEQLIICMSSAKPSPKYPVCASFLMIPWQRVLLLSSRNPNHAGDA